MSQQYGGMVHTSPALGGQNPV